VHGSLEDEPPNIKRRGIRERRGDNLDKILAVIKIATGILPDGIENGVQSRGANAKEHEDAKETISTAPQPTPE
jgi:hypothetical protein